MKWTKQLLATAGIAGCVGALAVAPASAGIIRTPGTDVQVTNSVACKVGNTAAYRAAPITVFNVSCT
jgi:hypothetical protein